MKKVNWDNVQESTGGFVSPEPGGYIAQITAVEDVESKEYLLIEWEFASGEWKGENGKTYARAGFWPTPYFASYKDSALGFFKHFKRCLEESNRGYVFTEDNVQGLRGRYFGVILGEEEYQKKDGTIGTRLKATNAASIQDIQTGNFKVPPKKLFKGASAGTGYSNNYSAPTAAGTAAGPDPFASDPFQDLGKDDGELPF